MEDIMASVFFVSRINNYSEPSIFSQGYIQSQKL